MPKKNNDTVDEKRRVSLLMPIHLHESLQEIGKDNGLDVSALINLSVTKFIREEQVAKEMMTSEFGQKLVESLLSTSLNQIK